MYQAVFLDSAQSPGVNNSRSVYLNMPSRLHRYLFNIGVEPGLLVFVGLVLFLAWLIHKLKPVPFRPAEMLTTYVIGGITAYWAIERVAGFWS